MDKKEMEHYENISAAINIGYFVVSLLGFMIDGHMKEGGSDGYPAWWCIKYTIYFLIILVYHFGAVLRKREKLTIEARPYGDIAIIFIGALIIALIIMWGLCFTISDGGNIFNPRSGSDCWKPFWFLAIGLTVVTPIAGFYCSEPAYILYDTQKDLEEMEEIEKFAKQITNLENKSRSITPLYERKNFPDEHQKKK